VDKFWQLLEQSTLVSGTIALALVLTCCLLWGMSKPVPQELQAALMIVLGFFFGAKSQKSSSR